MLQHDRVGLEVNAETERLLREEGGFTFTEMLVTVLLMIMVLIALHSIFDMSLRVFSFGNDKVEAVENARLGLERMERELRAAYPYDKVGIGGSVNDTIIAGGVANPPASITFGNDLNDNRESRSKGSGDAPAQAGRPVEGGPRCHYRGRSVEDRGLVCG